MTFKHSFRNNENSHIFKHKFDIKLKNCILNQTQLTQFNHSKDAFKRILLKVVSERKFDSSL